MMATYVSALTQDADGNIEITAQISSACCNTTYIFQQSKDGTISREGIEVDEGTRKSLDSAIKTYKLIRRLP